MFPQLEAFRRRETERQRGREPAAEIPSAVGEGTSSPEPGGVKPTRGQQTTFNIPSRAIIAAEDPQLSQGRWRKGTDTSGAGTLRNFRRELGFETPSCRQHSRVHLYPDQKDRCQVPGVRSQANLSAAVVFLTPVTRHLRPRFVAGGERRELLRSNRTEQGADPAEALNREGRGRSPEAPGTSRKRPRALFACSPAKNSGQLSVAVKT